MKKILVISEYFAPQNTIAAIRITKLVKYLKQKRDINITVISNRDRTPMVDNNLKKDLKFADRVINITFHPIVISVRSFFNRLTGSKGSASSVKVISTANNKNTFIRKIRSIIAVYILFILELISSKSFEIKAKKYLKSTDTDYDIILSSYGPFSTHKIASFIKSRKPDCYWIADFRDPVLNSYIPFGFKNYCKRYPDKYCKDANLITAVSGGVLSALNIRHPIKKIILTNGYDLDDLPIHTVESDSVFTFCYTGLLYKDKRDLTPFFSIINDLISEKKVEKDKIRIVYAGPSSAYFLSQLSKYRLEDICIDYGIIERSKALELQKKSHILLLASWNTKNEQGIITGKFLEYMMMDKPIIAVISGEVPNSEIKNIISLTNLGAVIEKANIDEDYNNLKAYILNQYNSFYNNSFVLHTPNTQQLEKYNYSNIVELLLDEIGL